MITGLKEVNRSVNTQQFSIVIPTWNSLEYLRLCLNGLRTHSHFYNQIIVFVNDGSDGTVEWLETQADIDYVLAEKNMGVCFAVNACRSLVKHDYIVYMNDDMIPCPDWDLYLANEIKKLNTDYFYLSATLIEPKKLNNPNYVAIIQDFGTSPQNFRENELLEAYSSFEKEDWQGSSWPPSVVHKKIWDLVGGFSIEFSPGMYSDPDFSMKLWTMGVRIFKGIGKSKVYHFGSRSTKRIRKNKGSRLFLNKWGMTSRTFYSQVLQLGKPWTGPYPAEVTLAFLPKTRNKLKKLINSLN
ncbi:MAG: glycosyltransferase family 2 protein [Bacteroidales bacterium]|nr:glycosyltransferase family 2 protein [Bacteroidales bacterium]